MIGALTTPVKGRMVSESTTLRAFTGGLNVIDDDMNLSYKFAVVSENIYTTSDGAKQVRYGTSLFANLAATFSAASPAVGCINMEYFNGALVVVGSNGEVVRVRGDGAHELIFSTAIAAALPGAPAAWSATTFASFAQFNGHLIICNGIDKPLDVDEDFNVEYLQDEGTGTNINIPICRYVVACQRFLVMAGDPLFPNRVHISARDAAGTWFGDPPPNDATRTDVGSVVEGANIIRGLMSFRDKLLVLFAEGIVVGLLGSYDTSGDEAVHEPDFNDGIKDYGCISHRATIAIGDDGLMADLSGVPSIKRTVLSSLLKPENASDLIDPLITAAYSGLSLEDLEDHVYSLYDRKEGQYLLFIPNADLSARTVFAYNYRPRLKQDSWAVFSGWNFTCATTTLDGNVFFGDEDGKLWLYGSRDNVLTRDYIDTLTGAEPEGTAIDWTWELPWLDFAAREKSKNSKYISFDTRGIGEFTCSMRVDNFTDESLSTGFSFGEQGGFGSGPQPYGGGRNTSIKKLYAWPCKFQLAKLTFTGSTEFGDTVDKFVSITMQYTMGSNRP